MNLDIDNITLDVLTGRLKNMVSSLDILKWLGNFKEKERRLALDFLMNFTVYNTFEIEDVLNRNLENISNKIDPNACIVLHPVGKFGKSGSMIAYFIQKTAFYDKNKKRILLEPVFDNIKVNKGKDILVLFDDFVGTGGTVEKYFQRKIKANEKDFKAIYFMAVAGMANGIANIHHNFSEIIIPEANIFVKVFSRDASFFGYRKYYNHRDLAYEYGKLLTSPKKLKNGNDKYIHALGYNNSQALVAFSYGCPNNTLPIIYASNGKGINWFPLIPRFSDDKINLARDFRKNISYELAILKEFGSENILDTFFTLKINKGDKEFTSVSHIDFSIYAIIKLKRSGFNPVSICHRLGIMYHDYEHYLNIGKSRGIFLIDDELTPFGLEMYYGAKKCIDRRKYYIEREQAGKYEMHIISYLPKTFNGRS